MNVNSVTTDEAVLLRASARTGQVYGELMYAPRIWPPIEYVTASGRAKCRACGERIVRGERCIQFVLDPYGGKDRHGLTQRAHVHDHECKREEDR